MTLRLGALHFASSKLRLMCSYSVGVAPRPYSKSLFYHGGKTRIVTVDCAVAPPFALHRSSTPISYLTLITTRQTENIFSFPYQMLSRAFTKPKRRPKNGDNITRSEFILHEYEDCIVGFMDDIPLVVCDTIKGYQGARSEPTLREVLRASVGVIGESCLGITEKVVFLGRKVCALKRLWEVGVGKREFGRRLQRVAEISGRCEHLVPVLALESSSTESPLSKT